MWLQRHFVIQMPLKWTQIKVWTLPIVYIWRFLLRTSKWQWYDKYIPHASCNISQCIFCELSELAAFNWYGPHLVLSEEYPFESRIIVLYTSCAGWYVTHKFDNRGDFDDSLCWIRNVLLHSRMCHACVSLGYEFKICLFFFCSYASYPNWQLKMKMKKKVFVLLPSPYVNHPLKHFETHITYSVIQTLLCVRSLENTIGMQKQWHPFISTYIHIYSHILGSSSILMPMLCLWVLSHC